MTKKYSKDHEWVELNDDGVATVGITDFAQKELGDVVYIDLPETGAEIRQDDEIAAIESVKAASDIKAPLSGQIIEINVSINDNPELVNNDAEGAGWLFRLKPCATDELQTLMDKDAYDQFISN